ncbi:MAG: hypothetical protein ACI8V7_000669 [Candidatus Paceibacteria bacterium]|jgi:hypothetical protein
MIATEYAQDYGIAPQKEEESDSAFRHRVAGTLRDQGKIIESHEVQANAWHDDEGGAAITGIMGAIAMALAGRDYGSTGSNQVGDEIAVGLIKRHEMSPAGERERRSDATLLAMLQMGMSPDDISKLDGSK